MRTKLFSWVLLCVVSVFFAATAQAAQVVGKIVAARVHGTVTAVNQLDKSRRELRDNDAVSAGYVVTTAQKSSVVLIFANGSAVNLASDSTLSIDEFLIDPFDEKQVAANANAEPSTSTTKLSLQRGELVGNVKHLNRDKGSSFTVTTPVGAAGIRGTTFQFSLGTDDAGKLFARFSTAEGTVFLTSLDGTERLIPAGKQVSVSFETTTSATGEVTIVPGTVKVTGVEEMPAATQAAIAQAVQEIVQANPAILNPPAPAPKATTPPVETTPGDGH
jgi:hypothetical protein